MRSVCVCALFAPANTSINRHVNSFLYLGFERWQEVQIWLSPLLWEPQNPLFIRTLFFFLYPEMYADERIRGKYKQNGEKREVMIFAGSLAGIWFIMIYWGWWPDGIREIIRTDISYTAGFKSNACEIWRLIPISVSRPILPGIAVYTRGAFVWLRYNSGRQGIQWR